MSKIKKIVCTALLVIPFFTCAMDMKLLKETIAHKNVAEKLSEYYKNATVSLTFINKTAHKFTVQDGNDLSIVPFIGPNSRLSIRSANMKTVKETLTAVPSCTEMYKTGADKEVSLLDSTDNKTYAVQLSLYTYQADQIDSISGAGIAFFKKEPQEEKSLIVDNTAGMYYSATNTLHGQAFQGFPDKNTHYNATIIFNNGDDLVNSSCVSMEILGIDPNFLMG